MDCQPVGLQRWKFFALGWKWPPQFFNLLKKKGSLISETQSEIHHQWLLQEGKRRQGYECHYSPRRTLAANLFKRSSSSWSERLRSGQNVLRLQQWGRRSNAHSYNAADNKMGTRRRSGRRGEPEPGLERDSMKTGTEPAVTDTRGDDSQWSKKLCPSIYPSVHPSIPCTPLFPKLTIEFSHSCSVWLMLFFFLLHVHAFMHAHTHRGHASRLIMAFTMNDGL